MSRILRAEWRKWFDKDVNLLYVNGYLPKVSGLSSSYTDKEKEDNWVEASTWFHRGVDLIRMRAQGTFDELVKLNQELQGEWEHYEPFMHQIEGKDIK